ncbi:ArnT family glycosyltransferase [Aquabacterium sp.]|uniref:ArnT family glycosyltransferase n=1 Tax=Aquabacterium sp. TaxID=1872578 RepID=UPI003B6E2FA8
MRLNTRFADRPWLLPLLLWVFLLVMAAIRPLGLPDEGRYAEIGRWMVQSGDWLTPRLNGSPFFHKPPYLYWMEASTISLFGTHILTARLAPVMHGGLMLGMLYVMVQRIAGVDLARRASLMLGTSLAFLVGGQYVNHDMVVASWISAAIWCFAWAIDGRERPHTGWALAGYAACGLGIMTKGLIGLALPGLVLLIWLIWTRQVHKLITLPWLRGLLIFGAIVVPWFALAEKSSPGMLNYLFGTQQFQRFTGTTFNNVHPWWFYWVGLLGMLCPWAFFAAYQALKPGSTRPQEPDGAPVLSRNWLLLCAIWLVAILTFFSIPKSKLIGYALPVMPPLAVLAAVGYERAWGHKRWSAKAFAALSVLAIALALATHVAGTRYTERKSSQDIASALACAWQPGDKIHVAGGYPYDLPYYAQIQEPFILIQDWVTIRKTAGDDWRREIFEGVDFDPRAQQSLQQPTALDTAVNQAGQWLVQPNSTPAPAGWRLKQQGRVWSLYGSALERPEAAEHKGLAGCNDQRHK